jgi:ABC-type multidrug transport system fused ATPase/permease subunit
MQQYLKEILFLVGDKKQAIWMVFLFSIGASLDILGLSLIAPYVSLIINPDLIKDGYLFTLLSSAFKDPTSDQLLIIIGILILIIFMIKILFTILINWSILKFSYGKGAQIRTSLMSVYQNLPYSEFLSRNSSEYIHAVQILSSQFSQFLIPTVFRFISEGAVALSILLFLAWLDIYLLAIVLILILGFIFFYDQIFKSRVTQYGKLVNKQQTSMVQTINESVQGFTEIRVLGKEEYFRSNLLNRAQEYANTYAKMQLVTMIPRYMMEYIFFIFVVTTVLLSIYMDKDMQIVATTLSVFSIAALRLMPIANTFSSGISDLRFLRDATSLLYKDLSKGKNLNGGNINTSAAQKNTDKFKTLSLDNVSFYYDDENLIALKNISIAIHAGDSIGIIGTTGSGKTTLINIFLGLLKPTSGAIYVNDVPLESNIDALIKNTAYIPQNMFLLDDTMRENIALGVKSDEIDEKRVIAALKKASLFNFVDNLPNGLNTYVGENGIKLSGGQRQRLALARAIYHERSVLVMDESTSALDNQTEQEIINEIKSLKRKKTIIIIAHRLTTIQHCDCIYRIENGKIIEQGSYKEVVSKEKK